MRAVLCLLSHHLAGPCAESRYNLSVPSLSRGRAMRAPGAQPPSDRESLRWELRPEQGPRQDRHQRGEKEGEAELRGFAGGCAREPLEQPYGCRQCRAPPASAAPVTIRAATPQQHGSGPAGVALGSPPAIPTLCSCSEPQQGAGRGQGGLRSGGRGEKRVEQPGRALHPTAPEHEPTTRGHRRGH